MARLFDEATRDPNANVPFRLAVWTKRRRAAADYVRFLAGVQPSEYRPDLDAAARELSAEVEEGLGVLAGLFPMGTQGANFADPERVEAGKRALETARAHQAAAMAALARVAVRHLGLAEGAFSGEVALLGALEHAHPGVRMHAALLLGASARTGAAVEALARRVDDPNLLVAEAALDALVRLAPEDLESRLARLFETCQKSRKELADGPIRRQILFKLSALPGRAATEAIARAVADDGEGDDRSEAVSKWAAGFLRARDEKRAAEVFLAALDSSVPHVKANVVAHLGELGVKEALPRIKDLTGPEALGARFRLGDAAAMEALLDGLEGPDAMTHAWTLVGLGVAAEPALLGRIESGRAIDLGAKILSRIGTERSVPVLERLAADHPEVALPLAALRKRLGK